MPGERGDVGERRDLVDDDTIRARIASEYAASGYVWCPHSATAAEAFARLSEDEQRERGWIAACTAHSYKFAEAIEPVVGAEIAPPPALAAILGRATRKTCIAAELGELARALGGAVEAPVRHEA